MNNIVILLILIFPGFFGVLISEFFTGNKFRNDISRIVISLFYGILSLIIYLIILPYSFKLSFLNNIQFLESLRFLGNVYFLINLLILFFISSLISIFFSCIIISKWFNFILKITINRSFHRDFLFRLLSENKRKNNVFVVLKLKSGGFLTGIYKAGSDDTDKPYIELIGGSEYDKNFVLQRNNNYFIDKDNGIVINLNDVEYISFNADRKKVNLNIIKEEKNNELSVLQKFKNYFF